MATVTVLTAEKMLEIEAASVVDGDVSGDNLILTRHDGTEINAGNVRGPQGPQGNIATADWLDWTPSFSGIGAMTLNPVSHPSNHARYLIIGKICFFSYSWVLTFGGTVQQSFGLSLPVTAQYKRQVFSGHVQNHIASAVTLDSDTTLSLVAPTSDLWVANTTHASAQGSYEIA